MKGNMALTPGCGAVGLWMLGLGMLVATSDGSPDEVCQISSLTPGHAGSTGVLVSMGYPDNLPITSANCHLTITVCAACKLEVEFAEVQLPPCQELPSAPGRCIYGCDHLLIHEPDYPDETWRYVMAGNQSYVYTTLSRRLYLTACLSAPHRTGAVPRRFRLVYRVSEKFATFTGTVNSTLLQPGHISSPNFPSGYVCRNEVYMYRIQNADNTGRIRLGFDDWDLSDHSNITIYYQNSTSPQPGTSVLISGSQRRPFLLSTLPVLLIKFQTGEDANQDRYIGFKAWYQFVDSDLWPDRPYTVCGEYHHTDYGGELSMSADQCQEGRVDCVWMAGRVQHPWSLFYTHLSLRVLEQRLQGSDSVTIRYGNSSEGEVQHIYTAQQSLINEFVSEGYYGYYVHLQAVCQADLMFHAVFASFSHPNSEGHCTSDQHFACHNWRCIFHGLRCDGVDHCGDNSDEKDCSTPAGMDCLSYATCADGAGVYCPMQRCDHIEDCSDNSDEEGCWITESPWSTWSPPAGFAANHWGTYVPIGLCALTMAIVLCIFISCCARRKRNAMRYRRNCQNRLNIRAIPGRSVRTDSETQLNINVEIQHYPDAPPTYEESIGVQAGIGIYNLGFAGGDGETFLPEPPPYTPRATEPVSIGNQLINSNHQATVACRPPTIGAQVQTLQDLANTVTSHPAHRQPPPRPSRGPTRRRSLPRRTRTMETVQESVSESTEQEAASCFPDLLHGQSGNEHVCRRDTCSPLKPYQPTNCIQLGLRLQGQLTADSQSAASFVGQQSENQSDPDVTDGRSVGGNSEEPNGIVQMPVCATENSQKEDEDVVQDLSRDQDINRSINAVTMVTADSSKPTCSATSQCHNLDIPPNSVSQPNGPLALSEVSSDPKDSAVLPCPENCTSTVSDNSVDAAEEAMKMCAMKASRREPIGDDLELLSDHVNEKGKVGPVGLGDVHVFCSVDDDLKTEDLLPTLEETISRQQDQSSFA